MLPIFLLLDFVVLVDNFAAGCSPAVFGCEHGIASLIEFLRKVGPFFFHAGDELCRLLDDRGKVLAELHLLADRGHLGLDIGQPLVDDFVLRFTQQVRLKPFFQISPMR